MAVLNIFVMRHGEAAAFAKSDQQRSLTKQGEAQVRAQGIFLKSTALKWDAVLVSPYIRAQETFQVLNSEFDFVLNDVFEIWDGLTPYGNAQLVEDYLQLLLEQGKQNILLISHQPLVGEIVKRLTGLHFNQFYPSTIAKIEWDGEKCELKFVQNVIDSDGN